MLQAGLNLIQQALSIYDSDLRLVVSNRRFQEMFDLPDSLVSPGATFEDTIRHLVARGEYGEVEDAEEAVRIRVEQARAFKPHYIERTRSNGRTISVEGAPLAQGGWVAVYTDITEIKNQEALLRVRSEELSDQLLTHAERLAQANRALAATNAALEETKRELMETEARTRLVTGMVPAHIAHVTPDFHYTFSNRRLSAVMPGSPSDIIGLTVAEALGPETFARIEPGLRRALAGEANVFETTHEGSGHRIRVALTPEHDAEGRIQGVYVLSADVTEETQARAALAHTAKRELAAQLTSGLAHDFSNLLTIIMGLQGRLERVAGLPPDATEIARATLAAARRGGTLLDRIARISGPSDLHPAPTGLMAFMADLKTMAGPILPQAITLGVTLEDLPDRVLLDPGALQDSLLNLIINARDAIGSRPGRIAVSARALRDTWLEFRVTDTGPGFSEKALKHALDPFFSTKGGEGSGLGLSMVYDQTKLAGGSVKLANRTGGGASVTLRLPLRPVGPRAAPMLVLLVEDSEVIRASVREMLRAMGHTVVEAGSVEEALELSGLPGLGLVLSDIGLPDGATGIDLMNELAARTPGLRRALMTSLPRGDALRESANGVPVLTKPFTFEELSAFVAQAEDE
ncbi:PAS-domain containing protein [Albidovulum sediminicola]|uniref:histidine kinase n=1 Tax=Albidovulum sediminicola TaxID=2984331 RepID=A0ABT2Z6D4_9RHOB|nr:PAS-domain containing protein [Defluviimonas sp. WL0075]MCV2866694.1 PAS-domain containing protein [Defluviimonas sp. WL0075]